MSSTRQSTSPASNIRISISCSPYTTAANLPVGLLIYAAGEGEQVAHHVPLSDKTLYVEALELRGEPEDILAEVRAVADVVRRALSAICTGRGRIETRYCSIEARHRSPNEEVAQSPDGIDDMISKERIRDLLVEGRDVPIDEYRLAHHLKTFYYFCERLRQERANAVLPSRQLRKYIQKQLRDEGRPEKDRWNPDGYFGRAWTRRTDLGKREPNFRDEFVEGPSQTRPTAVFLRHPEGMLRRRG